MATKSILKTVSIRNNAAARRLASALEQAPKLHAPQVTINRSVSDASREDIRAMFGSKNDRN